MTQKEPQYLTTTTVCFAVVCVKFLAIHPLRRTFPLCRCGRLWVGGACCVLGRLLAHPLNRPFVNDGRSKRLPSSHRGLSEFHWTTQLDDAVLAVLTKEMWINLSR